MPATPSEGLAATGRGGHAAAQFELWLARQIFTCLAVGYEHGCAPTMAEARRLVALRGRYRRGEVGEGSRRGQSARWLYEHVRIGEDGET